MNPGFHRLPECGSVNRVGLGTWATFGDGVDFETARRVIFSALDAGINHIDTAPSYANGVAEEWLGRILGAADRRPLVVSTKAYGSNDEADPAMRGLGRKALQHSVEGSLRRLRCERIDLLYCHRADPDTPLEETLEALGGLRRQGKIQGWGVSRWPAALIARAVELGAGLGLPPPSAAQEPYNRLYPAHAAALAAELAPLGVAIVGYSLLARGTLTGKYLPGVPAGSRAARSRECPSPWQVGESDVARIRRLVKLAESRQLEPATLLVIDALRRGPCPVILTAASTPEQVAAIAKGIELAQDPAFSADVGEIFDGRGN